MLRLGRQPCPGQKPSWQGTADSGDGASWASMTLMRRSCPETAQRTVWITWAVTTQVSVRQPIFMEQDHRLTGPQADEFPLSIPTAVVFILRGGPGRRGWGSQGRSLSCCDTLRGGTLKAAAALSLREPPQHRPGSHSQAEWPRQSQSTCSGQRGSWVSEWIATRQGQGHIFNRKNAADSELPMPHGKSGFRHLGHCHIMAQCTTGKRGDTWHWQPWGVRGGRVNQWTWGPDQGGDHIPMPP